MSEDIPVRVKTNINSKDEKWKSHANLWRFAWSIGAKFSLTKFGIDINDYIMYSSISDNIIVCP